MITNHGKSQTVSTFTATEVMVTNSITAGGAIRGQCITANDTLRAKDDVVAEQDLKVAGDINVNGNINAPSTSTANLGEINASKNIRTQNAFIFNTPANTPVLGMKVFGSTNSTNSGPVIHIGNPNSSPDPPLPCSLPNGNPWFLLNGGYIAKTTNGLVNASLSMYTAPWNGSSHIESEGVNEAGQLSTALFLNYFCGRDIGLCVNTGLANGGGKVSVGNFLSAARHVEIGGAQYGIAPNNSPANNIALEMHVNNGKAVRVRTYNGALSMFEIENYGGTTPVTVFKVDGDGKTKIGGDFPTATPYMLTVNGRIGAREIKVSMQNPWPDYVFQNDYKLQSLENLEKFLINNKHLPNIPSAEELNEEICGLDIAEMQGKQMEKIEEIYLHLIELNKQVKELQKENAELKNQIKK